MEQLRVAGKSKEIESWTEYEVLAKQNYRCDRCGHTIYAYTRYNRRVMREENKHRFLVVYREHAGEGCPEVCSSPYKW